jgi:hypothetical protein
MVNELWMDDGLKMDERWMNNGLMMDRWLMNDGCMVILSWIDKGYMDS